MTSEIAFSFIIPCLNEAEKIQACLNSLPCSEKIEVIVIDGGSQDRTLNYVAAHSSSIKIIKTPAGRAKQMNEGARQAKGRTLIFLHADSILPKACLQQLESFQNQALKSWGRFDIRLNNHANIYRLIESMINLRSAWSDIATGDQGIFVKRDFFVQAGGFPELALMEDIAFSKLLRQSSTAFRIKTPLETSTRRWESKGVIKTILLMWLFRFVYMLGVSPRLLHKLYYGSSIKAPEKQKHLLIVFTKNPEKGKVKTRLIPHIGEQKAYELYKAMLEQTLQQCTSQIFDRRHEIWVNGESNTAYLRQLAFYSAAKLKQQKGNELGVCLSHAMLSSKNKYQTIIVIGGDCVSISPAYLEKAFSILHDKQVVVGPAQDGGFVLVGFQARAFKESVFADIAWGTSSVCEALLQNIAKQQLSVQCLDTLWDVDEYEDLSFLKPFPWAQIILSGT